MNSDITVSPEWAEKLKEAGYPQTRNNNLYEGTDSVLPTAEEILRELPDIVMSYMPQNKIPFMLINNESGENVTADSLADGLAEMYCRLFQNHLLPNQSL